MGLKFVPVIVTVVPMGPEVGENEPMVGGCAFVLNKIKINGSRSNLFI